MWRQLRGKQGSGSPPQESRGRNQWIKLLFWLKGTSPAEAWLHYTSLNQSSVQRQLLSEHNAQCVAFKVIGGEKKSL